MDASSVHRSLGEGGILSGYGPLQDPLSLFLVQAVVILTICRLLGLLGAYFRQPKVIFEIIGGIILGPSAMGRNKAYLNLIFPTHSLSGLSLVANIGLVLYLFIVGMELDPLLLVTHAKRAGGVALVGMIVPFVLGIAISRPLFDNLQGDDPKYDNVRFEAFYVFVGTALSITAFPVLARILKESGLIYTVPGAMTMGAAALNDAVAWCLLILAISIANAGDMATAGYVFLSVICFATGLVFIVRPLFFHLTRLVESQHSAQMDNYLFALTLALVFMCAWVTALLGVHAIFGSFLFGLICMPRDSQLFRECNDCIEELIVTFTLPLYFTLSGLKTDVATISRPQDGAMVVLVCFVASFGKFIGAGGTAYFSGMSVRDSSVVAVLMNTRGLVELIVLNLGMDAGILNIRTFSVMVIMCLFTTFITCPIIEIIYPPHTRITEAARTGAKNSAHEGKGPVSSHKSIKAARHYDKIAGVGAAENQDNETPDEEEGVASTEIVFNLDDMVKDTNIGVVIDRIEHMEGIMKVLYLYAPFGRHATLDVTAMRFFEPSFTERDVFVGLNEDNKLLEVEEEATSINLNTAQRARDAAHKSIKSGAPEMLPLCMFSKAIGAHVEAYKVRGDPVHFPGELIKKSVDLEFNVILFPWRPSAFVEHMFWNSVQGVSVPIALLVQNHVLVSAAPEGLVGAVTGDGEGHKGEKVETGRETTRERSHSGSGAEDRAWKVRSNRSGSVDYQGSQRKDSVDSSDNKAAPSPLLHRVGNIIAGAPNEDHATVAENVLIQSILVIITGAPCDALLLPFVLRCSMSQHMGITVAICADKLSDNLQAAVVSFKQRLRSRAAYHNVAIDSLPLYSTNLGGLMHHIATGPRYDLIVLSHSTAFASPSPAPPSTISPSSSSSSSSSLSAASGEDQADATTSTRAVSAAAATPARRASLGRFGDIISETLSPETNQAEQRRSLGVSPSLATMRHPELGSLGELLVDASLSSFVLIYHEPKSNEGEGRDWEHSGIEAVPFRSIAPSSSAGGAGLHSIRESDDDLTTLTSAPSDSDREGSI